MLLNIFLHWEKMVELTLSLANVFGAVDVERSMSGDAGHFDDAADSRLPWFQGYVVVYIGGWKHL